VGEIPPAEPSQFRSDIFKQTPFFIKYYENHYYATGLMRSIARKPAPLYNKGMSLFLKILK
ncbi:MAG: hypothetical protein WAP52_03135, partial [Candidatus Sungiibacteriota bacterium]